MALSLSVTPYFSGGIEREPLHEMGECILFRISI